jgi:hypothetical protein
MGCAASVPPPNTTPAVEATQQIPVVTQVLTPEKQGHESKVTSQNEPPTSDLDRESTLDILMPTQSATKTIIKLPFDSLEDMIVDESVDCNSTLEQSQVLVNEHSVDVIQFFDSCRADANVVSRDAWVSWASKIGADIDSDTADNQFSSVCGYPVEEGGEEPQVPCDLAHFACCLVRVANLWFIQNKGNPMDSDIPNQIETFWREIAKERLAS